MAVDGSGDVIAAGFLSSKDTRDDFTVIKFSGGTSDFGGARTGRRLSVKDHPLGSDRRQIKMRSRDPGWHVPASGSVDDPTRAGATVRVVNPYRGEEATFNLPPGPEWCVSSSISGGVKYVYRDPSGINGPCTKVSLRSGRGLGVSCTGNRGPIPFTLQEPSQGTVVVSMRLGTAEPQCVWFGDSRGVTKDQGTRNPGPTGIFSAKNASTIAATSPLSPA